MHQRTHPTSPAVIRSTLLTGAVAILLLPVVATLHAADPRPASAPPAPVLALKSSGSLIVVGGGKLPSAARDRFLELAGGKNARLVIIPTASQRADRPEPLPNYLFWRSQGVHSVEVLHTLNRAQADDPDFIKPLTTA